MTDFLIKTEVFGCSLYEVLLWFLIYGVFGWIFESAVVSNREKKFINRGFLFGPFIPIYAFGITGFAFLLNPVYRLEPIQVDIPFLPAGSSHIEINYKYYIIFILGGIIANVLEYIVSFLMEKLFNQRWWDYTEYRFNNKGRTCLPITILWCLLSVLAIEFVHPYIGKLITDNIPSVIGTVIICAGYVLIAVDSVVSAVVAGRRKKEEKNQ